MEITNKLSAEERRRLRLCTEKISDAFKGQLAAGEALIEVQESKLYREDFKTFEEWGKVTFQIERAQIYRMMQAFQIKEGIEKRSPAISRLITTESQARELAPVPMEKRVALLREIAKTGEPVTAAAIRAAAEGGFANPESEKPESIDRNVSPIGDKSNFPRGTMTAGPAEKEAERPSVPTKKSEGGKPLHMLAIWGELENFYGKALNRLDELNRLCRNPAAHSDLIAATKGCMKGLEEWKDSVKKG